MTKLAKKSIAAFAAFLLVAVANAGSDKANGSVSTVTSEKKETVTLCSFIPFACVTTQDNGGGKEPDKPKNDR